MSTGYEKFQIYNKIYIFLYIIITIINNNKKSVNMSCTVASQASVQLCFCKYISSRIDSGLWSRNTGD